MKHKNLLNRILATVTGSFIALGAIPFASVFADVEMPQYPYTLFAASNEEGAITVNAGNFCVNGNVATNGTIG